jgi:hypothetical protein
VVLVALVVKVVPEVLAVLLIPEAQVVKVVPTVVLVVQAMAVEEEAVQCH